MSGWFLTTWAAVAAVFLSAVGIYAAVIVTTRIYGLRSYTKMSSFDFAMTVAIGTVVGTTVLTRDPPLLQGLAALASVFVLQWLVALARTHFRVATRLLDNRPLLLMKDGRMLKDNMRRAHVTDADLREKLRAANVLRPAEVRAVVLERAGDVSVLHGTADLEEWLLEDVDQ